MRITKTEVEGKPGHIGIITRESGSQQIKVELRTPTFACTHHVLASDEGGRWSMAEAMQEILDGRKWSRGDVREYFLALEPFAN